MARAFWQDARLLILDEPTASLSDPEVERLMGRLSQLRAEGVAILYVSHRLDEVMRLSDRVAVLRDGALVADRRTSDVGARADRSRHDRSRSFGAWCIRFGARRRRGNGQWGLRVQRSGRCAVRGAQSGAARQDSVPALSAPWAWSRGCFATFRSICSPERWSGSQGSSGRGDPSWPSHLRTLSVRPWRARAWGSVACDEPTRSAFGGRGLLARGAEASRDRVRSFVVGNHHARVFGSIRKARDDPGAGRASARARGHRSLRHSGGDGASAGRDAEWGESAKGGLGTVSRTKAGRRDSGRADPRRRRPGGRSRSIAPFTISRDEGAPFS